MKRFICFLMLFSAVSFPVMADPVEGLEVSEETSAAVAAENQSGIVYDSLDSLKDDLLRMNESMANGNDALQSEIKDLNAQIKALQNQLEGIYTGKQITITDIQPGSALKVRLLGETEESGEGEKSPDNPCVLEDMESASIGVSDGVNPATVYPVAPPQPLRSLPDGTADYIELADEPLLMRSIAKRIFNGTENWGHQVTPRGDNEFYLSVGGYADSFNIICRSTHYIEYTRNALQTIALGIAVSGTYLRIHDNRFSSAGDFKAYLAAQYAAGTPLTILYRLAAPTTEAITPQSITPYIPDTVITTDKGILEVEVILPDAVDPDPVVTDDAVAYVLTFCIYAFAAVAVAMLAMRFILGFCRTGLHVLHWLPFQNLAFKRRKKE